MIEKLFFQQPFLQSSVSHDPPEIILMCWLSVQETFLIIIYVENSLKLLKNSKEQHLFEIEKQSFITVVYLAQWR